MDAQSKTKAYKEMLKVLDKHSEILKKDHHLDQRSYIKQRIEQVALLDSFGFDDTQRNAGSDWIQLGDYEYLGIYGKQHGRTISWPDDGSQPDNEWLYCIKFPCGAYTFHGDYPSKTFNAFFVELKSFNPAYCDSSNHAVYFSKENAKAMKDALPELFKKHKGMVDAELKEKKKEALRKQLEQLDSLG